ncbi:hypothetical protein ACTA71_007346 [Dictyostelium dimigraforme]
MDIAPHVVNSDVGQQIYRSSSIFDTLKYGPLNNFIIQEKVHVQIIENYIGCNRNFNRVTIGFLLQWFFYQFIPNCIDCGGNQIYPTKKSDSKKLKEKKEQYEIRQDLGLPEEFDDNQDGDDEMKNNDDSYDSSNKKSGIKQIDQLHYQVVLEPKFPKIDVVNPLTIKNAVSTGTANITGSTFTKDSNLLWFLLKSYIQSGIVFKNKRLRNQQGFHTRYQQLMLIYLLPGRKAGKYNAPDMLEDSSQNSTSFGPQLLETHDQDAIMALRRNFKLVTTTTTTAASKTSIMVASKTSSTTAPKRNQLQ